MKDAIIPQRNKELEAVRARVQDTGISEPPIWRKGPSRPIRRGETCYVITFEEDWPNVTVLPAMVRGIDLIGRVYILTIKGRLRAVAAERIFVTQAHAEQEALIHAAINWNCYEAEMSKDNPFDARHNQHALHEEL